MFWFLYLFNIRFFFFGIFKNKLSYCFKIYVFNLTNTYPLILISNSICLCSVYSFAATLPPCPPPPLETIWNTVKSLVAIIISVNFYQYVKQTFVYTVFWLLIVVQSDKFWNIYECPSRQEAASNRWYWAVNITLQYWF